MCRKEKFSECPENPWRHFLELIRIFGRKKYTRGPHPVHETGGRAPSPGCAPLSHGPPGPPPTSTPTPYIHVRGEKNQREGFIAFYDTEPPPSPKTSGGMIWSPFGAPERGNHHHRHHQPSSITNFMMLTVVRE